VAQSNSVIGPQSSFMYSNPQWTINGFAIFITGLVVLACGMLIHSSVVSVIMNKNPHVMDSVKIGIIQHFNCIVSTFTYGIISSNHFV
jgi:hypothetical protein